MRVAETTVKAASAPLKRTAVVPEKFEPLIVTAVPAAPLVGVKLAIEGAWTTVKSIELVAVPPGVVTAIRPVVAPAGTVVLI